MERFRGKSDKSGGLNGNPPSPGHSAATPFSRLQRAFLDL
jgi:hypothetical protein